MVLDEQAIKKPAILLAYGWMSCWWRRRLPNSIHNILKKTYYDINVYFVTVSRTLLPNCSQGVAQQSKGISIHLGAHRGVAARACASCLVFIERQRKEGAGGTPPPPDHSRVMHRRVYVPSPTRRRKYFHFQNKMCNVSD